MYLQFFFKFWGKIYTQHNAHMSSTHLQSFDKCILTRKPNPWEEMEPLHHPRKFLMPVPNQFLPSVGKCCSDFFPSEINFKPQDFHLWN